MAASYEDQIRMLVAQAQQAQAPQKGLPQQVDPAVALMQAYQAYRGAHGGQEDPLAARAVQGPVKGQDGGVHLLTGANGSEPFQTTQAGPRAGQARQTYDLGDGREAHVYYTPGGKRKVFVFAKPAAPVA